MPDESKLPPPTDAAAELAALERLSQLDRAAGGDPGLFTRYLRALALLCECAPHVDEPDFADQVDEVLADACRHYPLTWQRDGARWAIALRSSGDPGT